MKFVHTAYSTLMEMVTEVKFKVYVKELEYAAHKRTESSDEVHYKWLFKRVKMPQPHRKGRPE